MGAVGIREYMTLSEAAERYGLAVRALRLAAESGKLPARKVGKRWVVRAQDIERWSRQIGSA